MRYTTELLLSLLLMLSLSACKRNRTIQQKSNGEFAKYAQLIACADSQGHSVFMVSDPWRTGHRLQRFVLEKPFSRVVVFTTSHCQLLEYLGVADRIVGVCDAQYILVKDIRRRLSLPDGAKGKIVDCGNSMSPDIERIVALKPDAIIISPYEGMSLGKLERLGIPVILAADYMETSALGRAEWMRYYGRLFGVDQRADSLFHVVDSTYQHLKAYAAKLPVGRSILTERKTGATWYTPGGRSSIGVLIKDANGRYAFSDDQHSGSLPLSVEQIMTKAGQSDVWAFKINGAGPMDKQQLLREYDGYKALKAFRTGEIYECNCSKVPYFEEVSWRPDYLLREMIQLLHPKFSLGGLRYYQRLKEK